MYWRRRLSRLELAIYAAVVAVVLAVFLERLLYFKELAERTAMELTVTRLNAAINFQLAYRRLAGHPADTPAALERSPLELAGMSLPNFDGEIDGPHLENLARGNWVYDRSRNELIYLPHLRRGLRISDAAEVIRFQLRPTGTGGYRLVPTSEYVWE